MYKKLIIIVLSVILGLFFSPMAFSQDDPSTTDTVKTETDKSDSTAPAGDKTDSDVKTVSGDTPAPVIVPTQEPKTYSDGINVFVNTKVLFKLTASDNLAVEKIEFKINEGTVAVYDKPFSIDKEGSHLIKFWGTDKLGNKEPEKAYSCIVDATGPVVVINTLVPVVKVGDKYYAPSDLTLSVNGTDSLSGIAKLQYSLNGVDFQDYVSPFKVASKGEINLKINSIDNVNNSTDQFAFKVVDETGKAIDLKESAIKLLIDSAAPAIEIKPDKEVKQINGMNAASSDIKYSLLAKDDDSGVSIVQYRINGKGDFLPFNSEIQLLTSGKHTIEAKAADRAGNESNVTTYTVFVDMVPPKSDISTAEK
jgi:hypothetical protein